MFPNDPEKLAHARTVLQKKARDNARTPVQWSSQPHGGFTEPSSKPWMRINDDYKTINVESQVGNSKSVHGFWERSIEGRKVHKDVFVYGDFKLIDEGNEKVVAYLRWSEKEMFITVLNFYGEEAEWASMGDIEVERWVAGNYGGEFPTIGERKLRPWEGLLGICKGTPPLN